MFLAALAVVSCQDDGPTQILVVAGSGGAGGGTGCTTGDEGCDCYPNDTCNASLVCRNGQCESIGSGGAGAAGSNNVAGSSNVAGSGGAFAGSGGSAGSAGTAGTSEGGSAGSSSGAGGIAGSGGTSGCVGGGDTVGTGGAFTSYGPSVLPDGSFSCGYEGWSVTTVADSIGNLPTVDTSSGAFCITYQGNYGAQVILTHALVTAPAVNPVLTYAIWQTVEGFGVQRIVRTVSGDEFYGLGCPGTADIVRPPTTPWIYECTMPENFQMTVEFRFDFPNAFGQSICIDDIMVRSGMP